MYLHILLFMFYSQTLIYFQRQNIYRLNGKKEIFDSKNKYNLTSNQIKTLEEINLNLKKQKLLQILENKYVLSIQKLEYINNYQDKSMSNNITKGGLYKDFNFEI